MKTLYLLDDEDVVEICHRYTEEDVTYADLAQDYEVDRSVIASIIRTYEAQL